MPIPPAAAAAVTAPRPTPPAAGARFEARLAAFSEPSGTTRATAPLAHALRSLESAQARLDRVLEAARAGRTFTAGELLALQSDAYRLAQTLDVAGKLVEHGVQSVKQAVNAQV
jgi:hypothetical protein